MNIFMEFNLHSLISSMFRLTETNCNGINLNKRRGKDTILVHITLCYYLFVNLFLDI